MPLLDEIAKGGTARPLAAFLVGRDKRDAKDRREAQDIRAQVQANQNIALNRVKEEMLQQEIRDRNDRRAAAEAAANDPSAFNSLVAGLPKDDPRSQVIIGRAQAGDLVGAMEDAFDMLTGPAPTTDQKNFDAAQADPKFAEFLGNKKGGITINTGDTAEKVVTAETTKLLSKRLDAGNDAAISANNTITNNNRALELLDQGVIAGFGAETRLQIGKALGFIGLTDGETVSRTEEYLSATAGQVLELFKQLGAGSGLSDNDLQFARAVAGGEITLTPKAMRKILELGNQASVRKIERFNAQIEKLGGQFEILRNVYGPIQIPNVEQKQEANEGDVYTNPETGQVIKVVNGAWIDMETGEPL